VKHTVLDRASQRLSYWSGFRNGICLYTEIKFFLENYNFYHNKSSYRTT
jgi:hypothetical protein